MNYSKVWILLRSETDSERQMARIAGMSPSGFKSMMDRQTMTVETLEKIAVYFKKPLHYFFDIDANIPVSSHLDDAPPLPRTAHAHTNPNTIEPESHYTNKPASPVKICTNPTCLEHIKELEAEILELKDDKRRLKRHNDYLEAELQKGGSHIGKSAEGGLEESKAG